LSEATPDVLCRKYLLLAELVQGVHASLPTPVLYVPVGQGLQRLENPLLLVTL
jgi:hypothetical protein